MADSIAARYVAHEDANDTWLVAIQGTTAAGEPCNIVLSRSKTPTSEEIELGLDKHHVQWGDQKRSMYAALTTVEIASNSLVLHFSDSAAEQLGVSESQVVDLSAASVAMPALVQVLHDVLGAECKLVVLP